MEDVKLGRVGVVYHIQVANDCEVFARGCMEPGRGVTIPRTSRYVGSHIQYACLRADVPACA